MIRHIHSSLRLSLIFCLCFLMANPAWPQQSNRFKRMKPKPTQTVAQSQQNARTIAQMDEEDAEEMIDEEDGDSPDFGSAPMPPPTNSFGNRPQIPNSRPSVNPSFSPGGARPISPPRMNPSSSASSTSSSSPSGTVGIMGKNNVPFADAQPEDITDENYPDMIESFDYPNADIRDVAKAISELTGKNFIIDPNVRGNISIVAPTRISVAEAYKAFLSSLAIHGFTVVPSGKFLKIKQSRNAQRDAIDTYAGEYFPNTDQFITKIIPLKYISAAEVQRSMRNMQSKDGDIMFYEPTNTVIISDYGTNVERVVSILKRLDVPGFEQQLEVIRIRYARARDIETLIGRIINKDQGGGASGRFAPSVPRFRRTTPGSPDGAGGGGGSENFELVLADERTNSIIVVGNKSGVEKVRELVSRLDTRIRPEDWGGVHVYYVKHGDAEKIANTLSGIANASNQSNKQGTGPAPGGAVLPPPGAFGGNVGSDSGAVFGSEVKIAHDKTTNSLLITASKQDYEVVKNILSKIDIPRDQVFVEAIIAEMGSSPGFDWGTAVYKFEGQENSDTPAIGRVGFGTEGTLSDILNPAASGAILSFASGKVLTIKVGGQDFKIKDTLGFLKFLQTKQELNILSTPQVMAMDNEDAEIEVGDKVPVAPSSQTGANGITSAGITFEDATIKLKITPFISPTSESIRMKIEQQVQQVSNKQVAAKTLQDSAVALSKRFIKTNIVVSNGDTAVLGGLMKDQEDVREAKVPVLGDIPILGWLFKSRTVRNEKVNLLVFMTPKIVRNPEDSNDLLDKKLSQRIEFIQKNMKGRDPYGHQMQNLPRSGKRVKAEPVEKDIEEAIEPEAPEETPAKETF